MEHHRWQPSGHRMETSFQFDPLDPLDPNPDLQQNRTFPRVVPPHNVRLDLLLDDLLRHYQDGDLIL